MVYYVNGVNLIGDRDASARMGTVGGTAGSGWISALPINRLASALIPFRSTIYPSTRVHTGPPASMAAA